MQCEGHSLLRTLPPAGAVRSLLFRDSSTLLVMISALICHGCSCRLRDELLLLAAPSVKGAPLGLLGGLPARGSSFQERCWSNPGQQYVMSPLLMASYSAGDVACRNAVAQSTVWLLSLSG
jgi:hypothetical protein